MAKLIKKSLLLIVILGAVMLGFLLLSLKSPHRERITFWTDSGDYLSGEGEVEDYIRHLQEENNNTKLILGDSVCNQMFNDLQAYNDEYCIAGNNRGMTMAGEYLLLSEFLKSHENVTDVYLVVGLDALESEIDITYGYQYIVVPFARINTLHELEDETIDTMKETFGTVFLNREVALVIGDSNVGRKLFLNYQKERYATKNKVWSQTGVLSDTTVIYLKKMYQMCSDNGIELHLLPDPLADNDFRREQAELLQKEFENYGLDEYFPDYFSLIQYYPYEEFMDGVHFGEGYDSQEMFNAKIQEMYLDNGYMKGLCLDFPLN